MAIENLSLCPRCNGFIPNNEQPGEFPGAISRVNGEEICSRCGMKEAVTPSLVEQIVRITVDEMGKQAFLSDIEEMQKAEQLGIKTCLHPES